MSKFADKISVLQKAAQAESALTWFEETDCEFKVGFSVEGYATEGGKNATMYFNDAAVVTATQ